MDLYGVELQVLWVLGATTLAEETELQPELSKHYIMDSDIDIVRENHYWPV